MTDGVPPLRWMASVLYLAVLVTGVYYFVAGLAPSWRSLPLFVVALLGLLVVERLTGHALLLLVVRTALIGVAAFCDLPGFTGILFVLVPFFAYFSLGRRWSVGLAVALLLFAAGRAAFVPGWWSDPEIVSDLLMLFAGMVLTVSTAAVADGQRRSRMRAERLVAELSAAQRQVAELSAAAERNRVARDIHDSVGHHLTAVSVQLAKASAFRDRDAGVADQAVEDARRAVGRALREVRESVGALRAGSFSLATAVTAMAEGMDDPGFRVTVELTGSESGPGLPDLHRVAQEALTNARRHACATQVRVSLCFTDAGTTLEVVDNGRGFDVSEAGNGLRGMRERVAARGGTLHIDSTPDRGTLITATIPALVGRRDG